MKYILYSFRLIFVFSNFNKFINVDYYPNLFEILVFLFLLIVALKALRRITSGLRVKVEESEAYRVCVVCGASVCCVGVPQYCNGRD